MSNLSQQGILQINSIHTISDFQEVISSNPGTVIIKFSAEWCNPCKKIEPVVHSYFDTLLTNPTVKIIILDIDVCFELYAFLKTKKMVNGIPSILCYKKGNLTVIPDNVVIGANNDSVSSFFNAVLLSL